MGYYDKDYLEHHGILGQKWGVRRFQNADGSLTAKGKARREKTASKIDAAYDKYNARIRKQSDNFRMRGQYSKSRIADEMVLQNIKAKHEAKRKLMEGDADYEKKALKSDMKQVALGDLKLNDLSAASGYSRSSLNTQQKAILNVLKKTKVSDLDQMSVESGLKYLEMVADARKKTQQYGAVVGVNAVSTAELFKQNEQAKYGKRKEFEDKFFNSKEGEKLMREASNKAYDDTVKYLKKNDPDYLKGIKKDNGGSEIGLDSYHDFRKIKEGYEDEYWDNAKEAYISKNMKSTAAKEKNASINDRANYAKKTGMYDMEFLERNLDINEETGEQLKGKALDDAYRKYLKSQ